MLFCHEIGSRGYLKGKTRSTLPAEGLNTPRSYLRSSDEPSTAVACVVLGAVCTSINFRLTHRLSKIVILNSLRTAGRVRGVLHGSENSESLLANMLATHDSEAMG